MNLFLDIGTMLRHLSNFIFSASALTRLELIDAMRQELLKAERKLKGQIIIDREDPFNES